MLSRPSRYPSIPADLPRTHSTPLVPNATANRPPRDDPDTDTADNGYPAAPAGLETPILGTDLDQARKYFQIEHGRPPTTDEIDGLTHLSLGEEHVPASFTIPASSNPTMSYPRLSYLFSNLGHTASKPAITMHSNMKADSSVLPRPKAETNGAERLDRLRREENAFRTRLDREDLDLELKRNRSLRLGDIHRVERRAQQEAYLGWLQNEIRIQEYHIHKQQ